MTSKETLPFQPFYCGLLASRTHTMQSFSLWSFVKVFLGSQHLTPPYLIGSLLSSVPTTIFLTAFLSLSQQTAFSLTHHTFHFIFPLFFPGILQRLQVSVPAVSPFIQTWCYEGIFPK